MWRNVFCFTVMTFEGGGCLIFMQYFYLHFADAFIQSNLLLFEIILTVSACCLGTKPMT